MSTRSPLVTLLADEAPSATFPPFVRARSTTYRVQLVTKRAVDVIGAGILLLVSAPILLVAGLVIRLTSPGPVLFRQERVGLGGATFTMAKLRTMVVRRADVIDLAEVYDCENAVCTKRPEDPRVTPVGRFLRRSSLDELPQLWNVLVGDMSLVGPRPVVRYMLEPYPAVGEARARMRPGLTGLWQVLDRSASESVLAMAAADLTYVRRFSLLLDARILRATIPACLRGEGAI